MKNAIVAAMSTTRPTTLRPLSKDHSELLNIIRALSAFTILSTHVIMMYLFPRYGVKGLFGYIMLVFPPYALMALAIISGFLITYSSLNLIQKNNSQLPVKEFLFKRFLRLYPALLFSIILMIVSFLIISHFCLTCVYHYVPPGAKFSLLKSLSIIPKNYLATLAFLQGIFIGPDAPTMNLPLWTLSYEFWYYILFMCITLIFVNKRYIIGSGLLTLLLAYIMCMKSWRNQQCALKKAFLWGFLDEETWIIARS